MQALRVLIVEDRPEDVVLMNKCLEKAGYQVTHKNIQDKQGLTQALASEEWDLILSDYTLPGMNGREALALKQELKPEIPFIFVTGTIGEETVVELLKSGAQDYIMKSNMTRLGTAVKQALETARVRAEKRRALEELEIMKTTLEGVTNGIEDRLLLLSADFDIIWANQAAQSYCETGLLTGKTCHQALFAGTVPCRPPLNYCPLAGFLSHASNNAVYSLQGLTWEVKVTPVKFESGGETRYLHAARDITQLQESRTENVKNLYKQQKLQRDMIEILSQTMEARDPYTTGHQKNVSRIATAVAYEMGINQQKIEGIYMASIIHDLGKIAVPAEILTKSAKLDQYEFAIIKTHSQVAYDILKKVEFPWPVARAVHEHHERLDGSGYPQGLTSDNICIEARVLAVADVVDAIASNRPYRPALGIEAALAEIEKNRGKLYDDNAVRACLRLFREKGFNIKETPA